MLSGMSYEGLIALGKPGKVRARFQVRFPLRLQKGMPGLHPRLGLLVLPAFATCRCWYQLHGIVPVFLASNNPAIRFTWCPNFDIAVACTTGVARNLNVCYRLWVCVWTTRVLSPTALPLFREHACSRRHLSKPLSKNLDPEPHETPVQVLRRPASREQAQTLSRDLHAMAMDLQDRELGRLDTVRAKHSDYSGETRKCLCGFTNCSRYVGPFQAHSFQRCFQ